MKLDLSHSMIKEHEFYARDLQKKVDEIHKNLHSADHSAGTTWVHFPLTYDKKELSKICFSKTYRQKNSGLMMSAVWIMS